MRLPLYRRQLTQDLDEWIAAGLVPAQSRAAILAHADQPGRFGLAQILGLLGAMLIAAAILSFVAANWQGLDKLPRLAILFGGLWAAFGLAAWSRLNRLEAAAEAALIVGLAIYGAAIWFVSQTYHIDGGVHDGLMLWSLGALLAAVLATSQTSAVFGFLLTIAWIEVSWANGDDLVLALFPPLGLAALIATVRLGWRIASQAGLIACFAYLILLTYRIGDLFDWPFGATTALLGSLSISLWAVLHVPALAHEWITRPARFWSMITAILATLIASQMRVGLQPADAPIFAAVGGVGALLGCGAALFSGRIARLDAVIAAAFAVMLAATPLIASPHDRRADFEMPFLVLVGLQLIWVISIGLKRSDRLAVNLGFAGFGLWVVYLYIAVFDSFLSGALFFLVGGVLLIALGLVLDRIRRRVLARTGGTP